MNNNYVVMKILILGGPGSGKSTTGQQLSKKLNIPHFDLDEIEWNMFPIKGFRRNQEKCEKLSQNILIRDNWIAEGYTDKNWTNNFCEFADYIFWLEVDKKIRSKRIIRRGWKRFFGFGGRWQMPWVILWLLNFNNNFNKTTQQKIEKKLDQFQKKAIRIKSWEETLKFIN